MNGISEEMYAWIEAHLNDDPKTLRLRFGGKTGDIDYGVAITQIECRKKFGRKLAQTLASFPRFYFPTVLAGEQATGDILAEYHAAYTANALPCCDLTAGLGIDVFHAASRASSVTAIELDHDRAEALRYNAEGLRADNVEIIEGDCIDFISKCVADGRKFTTVFIDPARRAVDGSRVFAISDCEPDVCTLMPQLAQICSLLVIKASPMLDITHTISTLTPTPKAVIATGTPTECKELIILIDFVEATEQDATLVEAVTISGDRPAETFAFTLKAERECGAPEVMRPLRTGDYIYESSPALMKSGAYKLLARAYGLKAFHANTRLFASENAVDNFPGNRFRVIEALPYASRVIKRFARNYPQINVAARNFGMSADALRAKLGVRDGGTLRLYGLTDARGEKILVVTEPA